MNVYVIFILLFSMQSYVYAVDIQTESTTEPVTTTKQDKKRNNKKTFLFQYKDEDLINIINLIAAEKNINVVLPQGGNAIQAKVTLDIEKKLSLQEAWNILLTVLEVAGFSMVPKDDIYSIVPTSPTIGKEPLPVFIGTNIKDLPNSDQRIRFVHYLTNIQASKEADNELAIIFKELMQPDTIFEVDPASNAIIVVGKSHDIRSIMHIISELDQAGFHEKMEIIKLKHTEAPLIADLFNQQILRPNEQTGINRYRLDTRKQAVDTYFSQYTRIIPDLRTNSLIVLGRTQAVDRLKEFIHEYIDVTLDSGRSILHIFQLQYLDAVQVADVLQRVVQAERASTGQAQAAQQQPGGIERYFDEVVIKADRPEQVGDKETPGYQYEGGNKLVIAARNDDWKRIKKLLEEIDIPQPQVLIEVLIADLIIDDERQLGQQTRNPDKLPNPSDVNVQSAQLTNPILNSDTNPTTVAADLLRLSSAYPDAQDNPQSYAATVPAGTSLISFNDSDGKTWSLLQVLQSFGHTKIISHPHVMATNNKEAVIKVGESRLLRDQSQLGSTAANIKNKYVDALLEVKITPRISADDTVNLGVNIEIQAFFGLQDAKINRIVTTNANVKNGSILALGGLITSRDEQLERETPVLGKIPILGWFFKNRAGSTIKNNLTVFISPTIIQPRLRRGISEYTRDYIDIAKEYSQQGELFDGLRDPITRWFFKTGTQAEDTMERFLEKDEFQNGKHEESDYRARRQARKQERIVARQEQQQSQRLKELVAQDGNPLLTTSHKKKSAHPRS
ncbi:MAG TPA: secretin N-terminal domain-containing protein [Candidatus Dependentiae bacterium]|nr:secretin N-terminal domain-containing protein [Candidatus Dependentiae bacterium]HRQ62989.1 secretin N-terminal domain-containing protein [Candidatus Dependentiae bacterium]